MKHIETAAAGIRAGRFPADPAYQACLYCPYRSICPRGEGEQQKIWPGRGCPGSAR